MKHKRICAVVFDLDGTLRHSVPDGLETFHQKAAELGLRFGEAERRAARRWQYAYWAGSEEYHADRAMTADQSEGAFWRRHAERHLRILGADEADLQDWAEVITAHMYEAYAPADHVAQDAVKTLDWLRDQGYVLGILSNRSQPFADLVEKLGLLSYFEFVLAAGELGWWKPDPRLFHHVAELVGAEPSTVAYVGDNFYADILGAEGAGLEPILIDPQGLFPEAESVAIRALEDLIPLLAGISAPQPCRET